MAATTQTRQVRIVIVNVASVQMRDVQPAGGSALPTEVSITLENARSGLSSPAIAVRLHYRRFYQRVLVGRPKGIGQGHGRQDRALNRRTGRSKSNWDRTSPPPLRFARSGPSHWTILPSAMLLPCCGERHIFIALPPMRSNDPCSSRCPDRPLCGGIRNTKRHRFRVQRLLFCRPFLPNKANNGLAPQLQCQSRHPIFHHGRFWRVPSPNTCAFLFACGCVPIRYLRRIEYSPLPLRAKHPPYTCNPFQFASGRALDLDQIHKTYT